MLRALREWRGVIVFGALLTLLTWVLFTPANAAPRSTNDPWYRGYVRLCIVEEGQNPQFGVLQTPDVYPDDNICQIDTNTRLAALVQSIKRDKPNAQIAAEYRCIVDPTAREV